MQKKMTGFLCLVSILNVIIPGCQSSSGWAKNKEILFQYSTLGSLMEGIYDGDMTFSELKRYGNFGLGTFNALDGEMIELDHQFYQIKSDGAAYQVESNMKTPFAAVTYFEPDKTITINKTMDLEQLKGTLDSLLPSGNIPYAVRITGRFKYLKTRSVPRQIRPYPRLAEVLEKQPTFEFHEIWGAITGFRLPNYMETTNAPGYHFHFISKDRDAGGHVLECQSQAIKVEIDYTNEWHVVLPKDTAFYNVEMSGDRYR